jgi:hypothetical protein
MKLQVQFLSVTDMNQAPAVQELLFQTIRSNLAPNISFVHDLSELLGISYDSAYRRIRGEKELSLDELRTICFHYNISVDTLFNFRSNHVTFTSLAIGENGFQIENWLQSLQVSLNQIYHCKQREIIYAAKDIPVFYFFEFPEIAAFKFYFWHKALIPSSNYENRLISLEPDASLLETGRQMLSSYIKIPTTEIWSEETIGSILRQIEYCYVSGFFVMKEDLFRLCDVVDSLLNHVQAQAEFGFQYLVNSPAEGIENTFKLFNNEVLVTDNTIIVETDGRKTAYNTYNVINQLITANPVFCDHIEKSLRNLMQKSTMISGTSAKERCRFFNILHEKVRTLRNRIDRMV